MPRLHAYEPTKLWIAPRLLAGWLMGMLAALTACGGGLGEGVPCDVVGGEDCDGTALYRCDGEAWSLQGACHFSCLDDDAAGTNHEAISGSETWTCAQSPHRVTAPLSVDEGLTLTLEAGAEVRLSRGARIDTTPRSTLLGLGTSGAPVLVTSDDGTQGGYGSSNQGGFNLFATESATPPSRLVSVVVERGVHGIGVLGLDETHTPPSIEASTFRDHEAWGILLRGCATGAAEPAYASPDNRFFANGQGSVSPCEN